MFAVYYL